MNKLSRRGKLKDSENVVAFIKGTEKPDEIILVGGHLDSWDIGEGAHDDGAGVVQSMEVLHLFKGHVLLIVIGVKTRVFRVRLGFFFLILYKFTR